MSVNDALAVLAILAIMIAVKPTVDYIVRVGESDPTLLCPGCLIRRRSHPFLGIGYAPRCVGASCAAHRRYRPAEGKRPR